MVVDRSSRRGWAPSAALGGQDEHPGRVRPARGADHGVEGDVQLVQVLGRLRGRGTGEPRFVDALEEQGARLGLEGLGDLRPGGGEAGHDIVMVRGYVVDPIHRVVVGVEHDVQAVGLRPVHDLLDPGHEGGVDGVRRGGGLVGAPGHRDADTVEAIRGDGVEDRLGGQGVAPGGFGGGVQGVAQVPAGLHLRHGVDGLGRDVDDRVQRRAVDVGGAERGGAGQAQHDGQGRQQGGQAAEAAASGAPVRQWLDVAHAMCLSRDEWISGGVLVRKSVGGGPAAGGATARRTVPPAGSR